MLAQLPPLEYNTLVYVLAFARELVKNYAYNQLSAEHAGARARRRRRRPHQQWRRLCVCRVVFHCTGGLCRL